MSRTLSSWACAAALGLLSSPVGLSAADRAVVWVRAGDADFERDLNQHAARGLRLAAISDGLPCAVAALQAPERPGAAAEYRVVLDRDLTTALPSLAEQGFVPKVATRRIGTRHHVVFERTTPAGPVGEWRLIEFERIETLEAALAAAAADGFQARVIVRPAFRSWPGLSEPGMVLAVKVAAGLARESRVLVGINRELKDVAGPLRAATVDGWMLDLIFTSARDGSRDGRRERLVLALSRDRSARSNGSAVTLERHTSFGVFGSGVPAGGGLFWTDYVFAWTPAARRQIWASPVQLSDAQANCLGLELKMRFDATNDELNTIVALVAKPRSTGGFEMVVVTEQRIGPS